MKGPMLAACLLTASAVLANAADDKTIDTSVFANARLKSVLERAEDKADRFEDKLDAALRSDDTGAANHLQLNEWAENLEDELDNLKDAFSVKRDSDFSARFDTSMLLATSINRAMLRKEYASAAETEWSSLRLELNDAAALLGRAVLPNITVVRFTSLAPDVLTRADIRLVMDQLEASTDRFEDKFKQAHFTSISHPEQKRLFTEWADALEDTSDDMLNEYKARNADAARDKLERTLLIAAGINRMMLDSQTAAEPVAEWNTIRSQLNTLAQSFGHAVLPNTLVRVSRTTAQR
jgi:hypothetical protein